MFPTPADHCMWQWFHRIILPSDITPSEFVMFSKWQNCLISSNTHILCRVNTNLTSVCLKSYCPLLVTVSESRKVMCVVPTANDMMSVFLAKLLDLGSLWFCSKPELFCAFIHSFIHSFILSSSRPGLTLPFLFLPSGPWGLFPWCRFAEASWVSFLSLQLDLENFLLYTYYLLSVGS